MQTSLYISNPIFIYDAGGERVLKAEGEYQQIFENGEPGDGGVSLNNYTTYPSPYMTIAPNKVYTKHYFAGTQRVASKPEGNAKIFNINTFQEYEELKLKQRSDAQAVADTVDMGQLKSINDVIYTSINPAVYYFHPDHLGTSTMISDGSGYAYQMFLNLPFGETMAEQRRSGTLNNPYKFNDYGVKNFEKVFYEHTARSAELDEETGLYYYGARYYDPRISNWLSVDPLAEQTMTPYQYTYQNPINLVDPTGMAAVDNDGWGKRVDGNGKESWEYSRHITKENFKDLGYSEYMGAGNVFSETNGVADGKYNYSLNADGSVHDNQGSTMKNKFKTGYGTTIWNLDKDNSFVAMGRTAFMSGNWDANHLPPNPTGISISIHGEAGAIFGSGGAEGSLIIGPGEIGFVGSFFGNWGFSPNLGLSGGLSAGYVDLYGGATNLEEAMKGRSASWGGQLGWFGGNYSTSVRSDGSVADQGVRQYNVNLFGLGMRGGKMGNMGISNGFSKSGTKFYKF